MNAAVKHTVRPPDTITLKDHLRVLADRQTADQPLQEQFVRLVFLPFLTLVMTFLTKLTTRFTLDDVLTENGQATLANMTISLDWTYNWSQNMTNYTQLDLIGTTQPTRPCTVQLQTFMNTLKQTLKSPEVLIQPEQMQNFINLAHQSDSEAKLQLRDMSFRTTAFVVLCSFLTAFFQKLPVERQLLTNTIRLPEIFGMFL